MQEDESKKLLGNLAQLKWACRRGMLELDVLLGNFLNAAYPTLSLEDKAAFVELLSCTDPELFSWLLGREVPEQEGLAKITEKVRQHARSRFQI